MLLVLLSYSLTLLSLISTFIASVSSALSFLLKAIRPMIYAFSGVSITLKKSSIIASCPDIILYYISVIYKITLYIFVKKYKKYTYITYITHITYITYILQLHNLLIDILGDELFC